MNQLEGVTYKQHPLYTHLYGTTDGRVFSSRLNKFVGNVCPNHGRAYVYADRTTKKLRYRLIWECFHGLLSSEIDIDHINRDPIDDRLCNLQALTRQEHNRKTFADNPGSRKKTAKTRSFTFQATKDGKTICGDIFSALGYSNRHNLIKAYRRSGYTSWSYNGWTIVQCRENIDGEVWKTGIYDGNECTVSNMGRVRIGQRFTYGVYSCGYLSLGVKQKKHKVHRLICTVFNGPPPSALHQVDHINGIKTDNRSVNLEWVLGAENMRRMGALKRSRANMEEE